jgi:hypothetical protein
LKIVIILFILTLNAFANCVLFISKEYEHNGKKYKPCGEYFVTMDYQKKDKNDKIIHSFISDWNGTDFVNNDFFFNSRTKIREFNNKKGIILNNDGISKAEIGLTSFDFNAKKDKFNNLLEGENGINEPEKIYIYKVNTNVNKKYRLNIFSITSTEFDLSNLNFEKISSPKERLISEIKNPKIQIKRIKDFQNTL